MRVSVFFMSIHFKEVIKNLSAHNGCEEAEAPLPPSKNIDAATTLTNHTSKFKYSAIPAHTPAILPVWGIRYKVRALGSFMLGPPLWRFTV